MWGEREGRKYAELEFSDERPLFSPPHRKCNNRAFTKIGRRGKIGKRLRIGLPLTDGGVGGGKGPFGHLTPSEEEKM